MSEDCLVCFRGRRCLLHPAPPIILEAQRLEVAKFALMGLLANEAAQRSTSRDDIAAEAVRTADSLLHALGKVKRHGPENT